MTAGNDKYRVTYFHMSLVYRLAVRWHKCDTFNGTFATIGSIIRLQKKKKKNVSWLREGEDVLPLQLKHQES